MKGNAEERQGCTLSPLLFKVYSEHLFKDNIEDEVVINGEIISNLSFADDTVFIADTAVLDLRPYRPCIDCI